ncbi:MAG: recombinase family protein [Clostridia bacterium]|nr:recombinase family protein [Clostridia bacterium]
MRTAAKLADIYLRLSVEEAKNGESESIKNQRSIIQQYCSDNGITIVREFIDDGFSGSNFERPGFKSLLDHIKTGLVNMVITKDLSRLGRNMAEASYYAETFFPESGIHYLAISDGFDSEEVNLMAPFQFAMNDVYLRDTSRKIKQVLSQKKKKGEYCACPPFGYMKNPQDKTSLIPDPKTAPIVQKIFSLAANGKSARFIAIQLTNDGDITPLKYRVLFRDDFGDKGAARATDVWCHTTVKRILKNKVYLGHTVMGKTKKASIKSKKKVLIDEEDWMITKNTHTPLVSQEQFDKAEQFMGINTRKWQDFEKPRKSIFNGLVYCENCGGAMCSGGSVCNGEREKYWYLSCINIPNRSAKHCDKGARIKYRDLEQIIKMELNKFIDLSKDDIESIIQAAIEVKSNDSTYVDKSDRIPELEKRIEHIDQIILKLYNDNASGLINDEQLSTMLQSLSKESESLKKKIDGLRSEQAKNDSAIDAYKVFFSLVEQYTHIDELTPEILRTFIERIEIGKKELPEGYQIASHNVPYKQHIKIVYRFIGEIQNSDYSFTREFEQKKAG